MTSKTDNKKQVDADILQCQADILRASDIIPSSGRKTLQQPNSRKTAENKSRPAEIPKFDLAEEIMAEQRKITAIRRKAPGKKNEAQSPDGQIEPIEYTTKQTAQEPSQRERIVAEIVARDIESLCRSGNLDRE